MKQRQPLSKQLRRRQGGAALLLALLTLALVAGLAGAALWKQWSAIEVERAYRAQAQMEWVLRGALDWARLLLAEDARGSEVDHLTEPWAMGLQEARLSNFLAFDTNHTDGVDQAFLSGRMIDQQGLLNIRNLLGNGAIDAASVHMFERLFTALNLPQQELQSSIARLQKASDQGREPRARDAAPPPLWPQTIEHLAWMGLSENTLAALRPYITLLPEATAINLNTAPAMVLYASLPLADLAQAQQMVTVRERGYFRSVSDALRAANIEAPQTKPNHLSVSSSYFLVVSKLRIDMLEVQEQTLVARGADGVLALWRKRVVPLPAHVSRPPNNGPT